MQRLILGLALAAALAGPARAEDAWFTAARLEPVANSIDQRLTVDFLVLGAGEWSYTVELWAEPDESGECGKLIGTRDVPTGLFGVGSSGFRRYGTLGGVDFNLCAQGVSVFLVVYDGPDYICTSSVIWVPLAE